MKIFISRFWGFEPERYPVVMFCSSGYRDKLIRESSAGDRIVFAATKTKETAKQDRGKLLGMAEFGRRAIDTEALLDVRRLPPELFKNGALRFPKAVPMLRAWRFIEPPLLTALLGRQLPRSATSGAVLLRDTEAKTVLAMTMKPVALPETNALSKERNLSDSLASHTPSHGPTPSAGSKSYDIPERGFGHVYGLQFGKREVWKIGNSYEPQRRADSFNQNIPAAVIGEAWHLVRHQRTASPELAYKLEQQVIKRLSAFSIGGEMFHCSSKTFEEVWDEVVIAALTG